MPIVPFSKPRADLLSPLDSIGLWYAIQQGNRLHGGRHVTSIPSSALRLSARVLRLTLTELFSELA